MNQNMIAVFAATAMVAGCGGSSATGATGVDDDVSTGGG